MKREHKWESLEYNGTIKHWNSNIIRVSSSFRSFEGAKWRKTEWAHRSWLYLSKFWKLFIFFCLFVFHFLVINPSTAGRNFDRYDYHHHRHFEKRMKKKQTRNYTGRGFARRKAGNNNEDWGREMKKKDTWFKKKKEKSTAKVRDTLVGGCGSRRGPSEKGRQVTNGNVSRERLDS